ncbi:ERF family protein [Phyllobacterium sp. YR531]|uniref:ERF family protein n=1 Tax=Phyllobacterium sp. YR531 TaxID=1144343 RepID=UPI00026FBAF4|nr:ERF family protein [Phyllobacterium sp. YR531]EJN04280.1 ERF superfamily protein [Phyllobacterium sp. YR531]
MSALAKHEEQNIAPANDASMWATIERVAMDPSIPIDRLKEIMGLLERKEDRAREADDRLAKKAYFAAMSKCQADLPVVTKTRTNTHTRSTYADLAAIEEQAMPIIHRYGFGVSFQPDGYNDNGELRILWEISHEEGHVRNGVGEIPVDGAGAKGGVNKTGTQAFGSTATYGRRYLLCMLFNISTGDDNDGNRQNNVKPEFISEEQLARVRELIEETETDTEKFCELGKIDALPDMLAKDFESAVQLLEEKKRRMAK